MANSKLLKEAIADAKAVKETAIANAKIALEEAFTPKLQSILSKKLQAEIAEEDDKEEVEEVEETVDSSKIGAGDNKEPEYDDAHTELDPETEKETAEVGAEDGNLDKVDDLKEGEDEDESKEEVKEETEEVSEIAEEEEEVDEVAEGDHDEEVDEELDLEAIIKELESDMEEELDDEEEGEVEDIAADAVDSHEDEKHSEMEEDSHEGEDEAPKDEMKDMEEEEEVDEDIDLDEILREMGYGEEEEVEEGDHEDMDETLAQKETELKEAYKTIKSLKGTINEVNLLNAKLLFANKLFRSYNLTNEQKVKVVETLDRTNSVREVKLVFSTLAESLKFNGNSKKQKIQEGIASKASASTAPKKEIIEESTNEIANRFKKLANLI
tara:strand:- start:11068 stop:12216 length:1149 start_codon:yes stop_codon:yes gene_type:complete